MTFEKQPWFPALQAVVSGITEPIDLKGLANNLLVYILNSEKERESLAELAIKIAPDYPGIESVANPMLQMYAIRCAYEGMKMTNDDLHQIIDALCKKLGLSDEEVVKLWEAKE